MGVKYFKETGEEVLEIRVELGCLGSAIAKTAVKSPRLFL